MERRSSLYRTLYIYIYIMLFTHLIKTFKNNNSKHFHFNISSFGLITSQWKDVTKFLITVLLGGLIKTPDSCNIVSICVLMEAFYTGLTT